jgi:hypothetical protein
VQRLGKHLAIWGSLLQLGIGVGFVVTFVQMGRAMSLLNPSEATQPPEVAAAIETTFQVFAVAFSAAIAGGFFVLAALFGCHYRAPWFYSVLWILSLFWLISSPLLGLVMIAYLILDGKSFSRPVP